MMLVSMATFILFTTIDRLERAKETSVELVDPLLVFWSVLRSRRKQPRSVQTKTVSPRIVCAQQDSR